MPLLHYCWSPAQRYLLPLVWFPSLLPVRYDSKPRYFGTMGEYPTFTKNICSMPSWQCLPRYFYGGWCPPPHTFIFSLPKILTPLGCTRSRSRTTFVEGWYYNDGTSRQWSQFDYVGKPFISTAFSLTIATTLIYEWRFLGMQTSRLNTYKSKGHRPNAEEEREWNTNLHACDHVQWLLKRS